MMQVYWVGCSSNNHLSDRSGFHRKLVMEAILETKAATILQFVHGVHGSLHVTSKKAPARPGCTTCSGPRHTSLVCDPRRMRS